MNRNSPGAHHDHAPRPGNRHRLLFVRIMRGPGVGPGAVEDDETQTRAKIFALGAETEDWPPVLSG